MKRIDFSKSFKKDMKDVRNYPEFKMSELEDTLTIIASGEKLPEKYRDHNMAPQSRSELQGKRAYHLRPNLVVIYEVYEDHIEVTGIGRHNKKRLTSSL